MLFSNMNRVRKKYKKMHSVISGGAVWPLGPKYCFTKV